MISFYKRKVEEPVQMQSKPTQTYSSPIQSTPKSTYNPYMSTPANTQARNAFANRPDVKQSVATYNATKQTTTQPVDVVSRLRQISEDRAKFQQSLADQQAQRLAEANARKQQQLQAQIPTLESQRDKSIERLRAGIPEQEQATATYKQQVEDIYGQEDKRAIMAERENQARLQGTFAGLGSLDSSVFQQQAAKSGQSLTEGLRTSGQKKAQELAQADRELNAYKRQVNDLIDNELTSFNAAIQQINETMTAGTEEYNNAVLDVYNKAQQAIYDLEDSVTKAEMDYQIKTQEKKASSQADALAKSQAATDTRGLIQDIIMRDLGPVTGAMRIQSMIPGTKAYDTAQKLQQLRNQLALAARGQLKGQGAVSDFESKILMNAVAALDAGQSEEAVRAELENLYYRLGRDVLGGGNVITAPDGQQIQIVDKYDSND